MKKVIVKIEVVLLKQFIKSESKIDENNWQLV